MLEAAPRCYGRRLGRQVRKCGAQWHGKRIIEEQRGPQGRSEARRRTEAGPGGLCPFQSSGHGGLCRGVEAQASVSPLDCAVLGSRTPAHSLVDQRATCVPTAMPWRIPPHGDLDSSR